MADRVYWYTITVPLLTPVAAPLHTGMKFNAAEVAEVGVIVPPGPAGSVGFQLWNGGGSFLPQSQGQYIVADNYNFTFSQDKAPNNGNWEFVAYNTDLIPHTIQVWFEVRDFSAPTTPRFAPVGL